VRLGRVAVPRCDEQPTYVPGRHAGRFGRGDKTLPAPSRRRDAFVPPM
jgi:hypothetical protein